MSEDEGYNSGVDEGAWERACIDLLPPERKRELLQEDLQETLERERELAEEDDATNKNEEVWEDAI